MTLKEKLSREDAAKEIQQQTGIELKLDKEMTNLMLVNVYDFNGFMEQVSMISGNLKLGQDNTVIKDFVISKWGIEVANLIEYAFLLDDEYETEREALIKFGTGRLMDTITYREKANQDDLWIRYRDEFNQILGFNIRFDIMDSIEVKTPIIDQDDMIKKSGADKEYQELGEPEDFSTHKFIKRKYGKRASQLMGFFITGDINADLESMEEDIHKLSQGEFIEKHINPRL